MKALRYGMMAVLAASLLAGGGCSCRESEPEPAVVVQQEKKPAPQPAAQAPPQQDGKRKREVGDSILHAPADYVGTVAVTAPRYARRVVDVAVVQSEIKQFNAIEGRYPKSLDELVEWREEPLPMLPGDRVYSYDAKTGKLEAVPIE